MSMRARIMTLGTPPPIDTPHNVHVMKPFFFKNSVIRGMNKFSTLELDIDASSDVDLKTLGEIPFDSLKIQRLIITHYFSNSRSDAIASVWGCTQDILMKLTNLTGLASIVIQEPFPIEMLQHRLEYPDLVYHLKRTLTKLDAHLCLLLKESQINLVLSRSRRERPYTDSETPRIYELFAALRAYDLVNVV